MFKYGKVTGTGFKNEMLQTLVDMEKRGIRVYLTAEGNNKFLQMVMEEETLIPIANGWTQIDTSVS